VEKVLRSSHTSQIDWPSLLLFGAGLSLGAILFKTGLASMLADTLAQFSGEFGPVFILVVLILVTIFFTELASNTASANIIIPVMIALSVGVGLSPLLTAFVFALACNSAFMLPVATPPNVIVYGTQMVSKGAMFRAGFLYNILCFIVLALMFVAFA
jgi:sodium-dependent dicarboxylate transporter 2/3/5